MKKVEQSGYVRGGVLFLNSKQRFREDVRQMKDCEVDITVKKKSKASTQSRRYYFGVVVKEITLRLRELGNDVDEVIVHEYLKAEFNKQPIHNQHGEVIGYTGGTTTEHDVCERMDYIERCIRFAAESLDLVIPPPSSQPALFARYDYDIAATIVDDAG